MDFHDGAGGGFRHRLQFSVDRAHRARSSHFFTASFRCLAAFATVQLRIPNCITQRLLLTVPKPRQSFALRCVCVCELRDGRPDARRGRGKEGKGPRERKRFRREYHRRRRQTVVCEKELSIHSHTFLFEKGRQPTGCVRLHTPLL